MPTTRPRVFFLPVALVMFTEVVGPALGGECVTWEERLTQPDPRRWHNMAFDDWRGITVLFGGQAHYSDGIFRDTWEWDGLRWAFRSIDGPPARAGHAMTFDSRRGVTVLFGGGTEQGLARDTWEWDGTAWSLRAADGPPAMWSPRVVYDSWRGISVLVGYVDGDKPDATSIQTWGWDGMSWTLLDNTQNLALVDISFDDRRGVIVLLGQSDTGFEIREWNGSGWTQVLPPELWCCHDFRLTYDSRRGLTVAYGGLYSTSPSVCEWDGSTWTPRPDTGLRARRAHAFDYDTWRGAAVLFGGYGRSNVAKDHPMGDTWEWDGNAWSQRQQPAPTLGSSHTAAFDRRRNQSLLHFDGYPAGSTWGWSEETWTNVSRDGPPYSTWATMSFDESRGLTVLIGTVGDYDGHLSMSTWEWDGMVWTDRKAQVPVPRWGQAVTYDSHRGATLLFGGESSPYDGLLDFADLWSWNGSQWTIVSPSGPPPRSLAAMSYDRARDRVVLFGGMDYNGFLPADVWEWDGDAWTQIPAPGPAPRFDHAMVYDESRQVTVLFGGYDASWLPFDDTWEWDGNNWTRVPRPTPGPRAGHTMVYDTARQRVILFGGSSDPEARHVWELALHQLPQDSDDDCDVDLSDLAAFQTCFGDTQPDGPCARFDADSTGDVSLADFASVRRKLTGPYGSE